MHAHTKCCTNHTIVPCPYAFTSAPTSRHTHPRSQTNACQFSLRLQTRQLNNQASCQGLEIILWKDLPHSASCGAHLLPLSHDLCHCCL